MKIHLYQIITRLFGNKKSVNKPNGSIDENGCGKFNDITIIALNEIKSLGITHIWYTGILEHASLTAYENENILADYPDYVKGKAGSPYAIRDYYDVCPDLAVNVSNRMNEFIQLINRTHQTGLKAIIDFVPNHVSRNYKSDAKPLNIKDLGKNDNNNFAFMPQNNFYYISGEKLQLPIAKAGSQQFVEIPAKVTGNDCFTATPSVNDWYETVKLNYGIDYLNGKSKHFDPIPDTWVKMTDILLFWAKKGVDGFRCDMAEMVPVEFWNYAIGRVKKEYAEIIFIAEVYNPELYRSYIYEGGFDLLYDKVGLYDTLRGIIEGHKWANDITNCWQQTDDIREHMLCFLENHDEQRIASEFFASDAWRAIPALVVSCCLGRCSYMQYFGQELGEKANDAEGYSGKDGRTSIFDYWGIKEHQKWMNKGAFDGALLSETQRKLRSTYKTLLNLALNNETLQNAAFYDLQWFNKDNNNYNSQYIYSFLRYSEREVLLFVVNFDISTQYVSLKIPEDALQLSGLSLDSTGSAIYSTSNENKSISLKQSLKLDANGVLIVKFDK
ncbi:MAG TPA: alpha-amylase family glycosyl hydrolase [Bacteroidales bacterium]|nr:alpha-amylase family glycosyl hydrolase [Bacteroidales bacterium]